MFDSLCLHVIDLYLLHVNLIGLLLANSVWMTLIFVFYMLTSLVFFLPIVWWMTEKLFSLPFKISLHQVITAFVVRKR